MTERVGLVGWPVEHSISPAMHNAAFAALGLDWHYDLLPIPPKELAMGFSRLLGQGYRGFNVTVPHKRSLLAAVGRIQPDEGVQRIGATNTITVGTEGDLIATNTDWRGFRDDLLAHGINPKGWPCLILGTGGSARAVAFALRQMEVESITFVSRKPGKPEDRIHYRDLDEAINGSGTLIVNCTPVGMWPQIDTSPWPESVPFPQDTVVYDLVYNPAETALMRQARAAGARAVGGLGMLVRQGALSFEAWTSTAPPLEVMEQAARESLKDRLDA